MIGLPSKTVLATMAVNIQPGGQRLCKHCSKFNFELFLPTALTCRRMGDDTPIFTSNLSAASQKCSFCMYLCDLLDTTIAEVRLRLSPVIVRPVATVKLHGSFRDLYSDYVWCHSVEQGPSLSLGISSPPAVKLAEDAPARPDLEDEWSATS